MNKKEVKKSLENKFKIGDNVYLVEDNTIVMGTVASAKLNPITCDNKVVRFEWFYGMIFEYDASDFYNPTGTVVSINGNGTLQYTNRTYSNGLPHRYENELFATFEEAKAEYIKREKEKRKEEFGKTLLSFLGVNPND